MSEKSWEQIAEEQGETLLIQQGVITSLEDKIKAIIKLAPDLIEWIITGVEWDVEGESTRSPEEDDRIKREVEDLLKRFTKTLGIEEEFTQMIQEMAA